MANGANASSYSKKAEAGTRNNKKICTPDIPRCLYESCDSSKLCGVQIGTVEVLFYNDHIFLCFVVVVVVVVFVVVVGHGLNNRIDNAFYFLNFGFVILLLCFLVLVQPF